MKKLLILPCFLLISGCAMQGSIQEVANACAYGEIKSYHYSSSRERITFECR